MTQLELEGPSFALEMRDLSIEDAVRGGLFCCSGPLVACVENLQPGMDAVFEFQFCFLVSMEHRFDLLCKNLDVAPYTVPAQLKIIVKQ